MSHWLAGLLAAGVAWFFNIMAVRLWGERAVIFLIPFLEELIKTVSALVFGASLLWTHGIFGLVEAVHDYIFSRRYGLLAGLSGIFAHWFFGGITHFLYHVTSAWIVSIAGAAVIHVIWNLLVVRFIARLLK